MPGWRSRPVPFRRGGLVITIIKLVVRSGQLVVAEKERWVSVYRFRQQLHRFGQILLTARALRRRSRRIRPFARSVQVVGRRGLFVGVAVRSPARTSGESRNFSCATILLGDLGLDPERRPPVHRV